MAMTKCGPFGGRWQLQFLIYTVLQRVFMPLTGWRQAQILAKKKTKYNKIETVKGKQEAETTGRKSVVLKAHLHISFGFRLHI